MLIPILVLLDQITKLIFTNKIIFIREFPIIFYRQNTGIAFSYLQNQNFILTLINILIIFVLSYYYFKHKDLRLGLSLMISGSAGNTIDRIFHGYVIDFINIKIWPIFNLADVIVALGVILIVMKLIKEK